MRGLLAGMGIVGCLCWVPMPVSAASLADGTYELTLAFLQPGSARGQCPQSLTRKLVVKNGIATLTYNGAGPISGNVNANGALSMSKDTTSIAGQFSGANFSGKLTSMYCVFKMDGSR